MLTIRSARSRSGRRDTAPLTSGTNAAQSAPGARGAARFPVKLCRPTPGTPRCVRHSVRWALRRPSLRRAVSRRERPRRARHPSLGMLGGSALSHAGDVPCALGIRPARTPPVSALRRPYHARNERAALCTRPAGPASVCGTQHRPTSSTDAVRMTTGPREAAQVRATRHRLMPVGRGARGTQSAERRPGPTPRRAISRRVCARHPSRGVPPGSVPRRVVPTPARRGVLGTSSAVRGRVPSSFD